MLGGFAAVVGFLIVSGYSIAHSVYSRAEGFYTRRVLRIYPLYALSVLLSLLPFMFGPREVSVIGADFHLPGVVNTAGNLLFAQTFFVKPAGANPVLWTLAVEVGCYLCAPWLAKCRARTLILFIAASALLFLYGHFAKWAYYSELKWGLPFLMLSWIWIVGFALRRVRNSTIGIGSIFAGTLIVSSIYFHSDAFYGNALVASCLLVLAVAPAMRLPMMLRHVLRYLGDLSYPLYLFHFPVIMMAWGPLGVRNPWSIAAATVAVSAVMLFVDRMLKVGFTQAMTLFTNRAAARRLTPTVPTQESPIT